MCDCWHSTTSETAPANVAASGCAAFIRDYPDLLADDAAYVARSRRIAETVRDPIEILADASLIADRPPRAPRVAVQEPCTLRNRPNVTGKIAALLAALGYQPQPVADAPRCCGSAGAYGLLQPEFSRQLRAEKLTALTAHDPQAIYTANIGCWLHLGETSPVPVRHWIEAVDDVLGPRSKVRLF